MKDDSKDNESSISSISVKLSSKISSKDGSEGGSTGNTKGNAEDGSEGGSEGGLKNSRSLRSSEWLKDDKRFILKGSGYSERVILAKLLLKGSEPLLLEWLKLKV